MRCPTRTRTPAETAGRLSAGKGAPAAGGDAKRARTACDPDYKRPRGSPANKESCSELVVEPRRSPGRTRDHLETIARWSALVERAGVLSTPPMNL